MQLTDNAIKLLEERYLLRDDSSKIIETPEQLFRRVASAIAKAEILYGPDSDIKELENKFYEIMTNLEFLPNSPTLMNAGTLLGQLSACFVLPIEDSLESIYSTLKNAALIHQTAGGTGFSFSELRPKDELIASTKGRSSGPVSFIEIFNKSTEIMKLGGKRRGANNATLRIDHPDIEEFITAKLKGGFKNFNFSIAVTDKFIDAVLNKKKFDLINNKGKTAKTLKAVDLFNLICDCAWKCGDPCMLFIDEINRKNPLASLGKLETTNPCGELPLYPYESCNLGSINLSKFVKANDIDLDRLSHVINLAVHFLDNVIDVNKYLLPKIERATKANRKIGLGITGFADALVKLGIPYNSSNAIKLAGTLMEFISDEARKASVALGEKRGSFPNFGKSIWKAKYKCMRNATVTTIPPTGSISIMADCSSSIEPIFSLVFYRRILGGKEFMEINKLLVEELKKQGVYSKQLINKISKTGTLAEIKGLSSDLKKIFVTAHEIKPEWHIKMQAAFQKHVDNAISKTINLPNKAKVSDIKNAILLAHKLKCKGITVYRDKSKKGQVLNIGKCIVC